jgi:membrane-associated phospholipid phosphatase
MHHPSDVVAGALLGCAVLAVAFVAMRAGERAATERHRRHAPSPERSLDAEAAS